MCKFQTHHGNDIRSIQAKNTREWMPHHLAKGKRLVQLTHWGRLTHICVGKLTIIGPDNGLSPGRHQAIIWTNAGILLIAPLGTNFSEILIGIKIFSFRKIHLKISSAKWGPFCLGLNVLMAWCRQATTNYLNQRWSKSETSYGVTMPRWANGRLMCSFYITIRLSW